jgi:sirohydrochlorin ferrochelatase
MKGLLILAHGSKWKETEETLSVVVDMLREELGNSSGIGAIETAFLQFSDKTLHSGLKALADKGIDDIVVIPYFLFAGTHIKEDIPEEIAEFTKEYPNIRIHFGNTLGTDKRLALILKDRVIEMM